MTGIVELLLLEFINVVLSPTTWRCSVVLFSTVVCMVTVFPSIISTLEELVVAGGWTVISTLMSLETTSPSSSTLDDRTVTVLMFSQSLTSRSPPACSSNKQGSMFKSISPTPLSKRHDLLRIWVFVDSAEEVLQSLHSDHDDHPGRSTGSGVCSGRDATSTTATI